MVRNDTARSDSWPMSNQWHANSSFIKITFHASQGTVRVKRIWVMPTFVMMSVITGEHHHCVFCDTQFLQQCIQPSNITIHASNHRRLTFILFLPRLVFIDSIIRHFLSIASTPCSFVIGVRNRQCQIQKERGILTSFDKFDGFLHDEVVTVVNSFCRPASFKSCISSPGPLNHITQLFLFFITP